MALYRTLTNKQSKIYCALYIHDRSVDSFKLLKEINKQAAKHDRIINVLLELHIAEEETNTDSP